MIDAYETIYKWEWFQRAAWRPSFRQWKAASPAAFKTALGGDKRPVLDCSCGLGLKTIVMKEAGLNVWGSDACKFAVEKARTLAAMEKARISFFVSKWADLPKHTTIRFGGVFNDALSCVETEAEFLASIRGIRRVLAPSGILVFFGAREGSKSGDGLRLMRRQYAASPAARIAWRHTAGRAEVTCIVTHDLHDDIMHERQCFLISDRRSVRLESAVIRQPACWDWPRIRRLFRLAGYSGLRTEVFRGLGAGGADFTMNVAVK